MGSNHIVDISTPLSKFVDHRTQTAAVVLSSHADSTTRADPFIASDGMESAADYRNVGESIENREYDLMGSQ
jgi:hypothetical protein